MVFNRQLPWPFNSFGCKEPYACLVECTKCTSRQSFTVMEGVYTDSDSSCKSDSLTVSSFSEIPKICPECGGEIKMKKMKLNITH